MVRKHAKIASLNYFKVLVGIVLFGIAFCALMIPAAMSAYAGDLSQNFLVKQEKAMLTDNANEQETEPSNNLVQNESIIDETKGDANISIELDGSFKKYFQSSLGDSLTVDLKKPLKLQENNDQEFTPGELHTSSFKFYQKDEEKIIPLNGVISRNTEEKWYGLDSEPAALYAAFYNSKNELLGYFFPGSKSEKDWFKLNPVINELAKIVLCAYENVVPIYLNNYVNFVEQNFQFLKQQEKTTDLYFNDTDYYFSKKELSEHIMLQPYKVLPMLSGGGGTNNHKYAFLINKKVLSSITIDEMTHPNTWDDQKWMSIEKPDGLNMIINFKDEKGHTRAQILRRCPMLQEERQNFDIHWNHNIYKLNGYAGICNGLYEDGDPLGENISALQIDSDVSTAFNVWLHVDCNFDSFSVDTCRISVKHSILPNIGYSTFDSYDASTSQEGVSSSFSAFPTEHTLYDQSFFLASTKTGEGSILPKEACFKWIITYNSDDTLSIRPANIKTADMNDVAFDQSQETFVLAPEIALGTDNIEFDGWEVKFLQPGDPSKATNQYGDNIKYSGDLALVKGDLGVAIPANIEIIAKFKEKLENTIITGQVNDISGNPLQGAIAKFKYNGSADIYSSSPTGNDGKYSIEVPLPEGDEDGQLWVELPDGTVLCDPIEIDNEDLQKGEVEVPPIEVDVLLKGKVFDINESPLKGALVKFQYNGSSDIYTSKSTNKNGQYSLNVPISKDGESGQLWVERPDGIVLSYPKLIKKDELLKGIVEKDIIVDVVLAGQILDPSKQPVKGTLVKFQYNGSSDIYTSEPTDEIGFYSLLVPPPIGGESGQLWVELPDGTVLKDPITIKNDDLEKGWVNIPAIEVVVEEEGEAVIMTFDDNHAYFSMFAYDVVDGFPALTDFQSWKWLNVEFNDEGYFVVDEFGRLNYYFRTGTKSNGEFDYKHVVIYAVPTEGYEVDTWYINSFKLYVNIPYKASLFKFSEDAQLYVSVDYKEQVGPVPPVPPTPPDPPVPPGPVPPQPVPPVPPQPVPPFNPGGDIPATGDNTLGIIMLSMLACAGACCVFVRKRKSFSK